MGLTQDWRPIESAPEGVDVLAFFPDAAPEYAVMIVHRVDGEGAAWYAQDADANPRPLDVEPTHWMPLPAPPD